MADHTLCMAVTTGLLRMIQDADTCHAEGDPIEARTILQAALLEEPYHHHAFVEYRDAVDQLVGAVHDYLHTRTVIGTGPLWEALDRVNRAAERTP